MIIPEEISIEEVNKSKAQYLRHNPDECIFEPPKASWAYLIHENEFQALDVELLPKQSLNSRADALGYMTEGVVMRSNLDGGVTDSVNRSITG